MQPHCGGKQAKLGRGFLQQLRRQIAAGAGGVHGGHIHLPHRRSRHQAPDLQAAGHEASGALRTIDPVAQAWRNEGRSANTAPAQSQSLL